MPPAGALHHPAILLHLLLPVVDGQAQPFLLLQVILPGLLAPTASTDAHDVELHSLLLQGHGCTGQAAVGGRELGAQGDTAVHIEGHVQGHTFGAQLVLEGPQAVAQVMDGEGLGDAVNAEGVVLDALRRLPRVHLPHSGHEPVQQHRHHPQDEVRHDDVGDEAPGVLHHVRHLTGAEDVVLNCLEHGLVLSCIVHEDDVP
mmetsp:Transcript_29283/g.52666  ORF Transcript_29283/g.52666 Transcript_29283/m.52666 type:complete len:201 (+) Transcript_29283:432-1034(+)